MKLLGLALSLAIGFTSTANAGLFAEPYLGYGIGKSESKPSGAKSDISSTVIGGRFGGEFTMLFVAADYSMSLASEIKPESGGSAIDASSSQLYAVVGANLPIVRLWLGYGIMNEVKADTTPETTYSGGSHLKLGVGFKIIPMLSLNAEYIMENYDKAKVGSLEGSTDLDVNTIMLSASVPLSF